MSSGSVAQYSNVLEQVFNSKQRVSFPLLTQRLQTGAANVAISAWNEWFIFCTGLNQHVILQAVLISKHQATRPNSAAGRCKLLDDHFTHTAGVSFNENEELPATPEVSSSD